MSNVSAKRVSDLTSASASCDLSQQHEQTWDAVETYFECITTCSLDDGDCITRCVEQLKDTDD
ncbi:MAG: hypothetical protein AB8A46_09175 [Prochlorococcus sp.]|nr:hypothetical protein [Prochlorococcaceae cyanobacterium ETNP18_MAG_1]